MDLRNILAKFDAVENNTAAKTVAQEKQKNTMSSLLESLDRISEAAKPDYLDLDKDGDKKEPMKKAAADKKKSPVKEARSLDQMDPIRQEVFYFLRDIRDRLDDEVDADVTDDIVDELGDMRSEVMSSGDDLLIRHYNAVRMAAGDNDELYDVISDALHDLVEEDDSPIKEGARPYAPVYLQTLKQQFSDKPELSRSEKAKVADIIKKSSIEHLKQLAAADIAHVSNAAKYFLKHNTPGGMKEEVELEEAIMVSAEGDEAEALLQILKLSGMPMPPAPAALPAPAADLDTMDIEMQDEYSNSPDEFEQDVDAVIANGTDLHREKGQYPAAARGDNPMAAFEGKFKAIMADLLKE